MKRLTSSLLFGLALLLFSTACSKTEYNVYSNISGIVIDADDGEPIEGATVTMSPGGLNTHTGSDGHFDFKDIDAQQYTITVQKTGYQANRKTIEAPSGETVNISITMKKQ